MQAINSNPLSKCYQLLMDVIKANAVYIALMSNLEDVFMKNFFN